MLLLEALRPIAQFDLKAKVDPTVACSDASEHGGEMCFASRLRFNKGIRRRQWRRSLGSLASLLVMAAGVKA